MNKINQWLTLFANLGVLAGVFFLAAEMSQNTAMMRSQTRDAMTEKQMFFYAQVISDPDVNRNFNLALELGEEYDPAVAHARNLFRTQLRMWENEWYQYEQGLFEDGEFEPRLKLWKSVLQSNTYMEFWETIRNTHSPNFREQIDVIVAENRSLEQ